MDGTVTIKTELDTKSFEHQIAKLEDDLDTLQQEFDLAKKWNLPESDLLDYQDKIEKINNKLLILRKRQVDISKVDLSQLGKSMNNVVKSVTRWGLAIFGIRGAYMAVRNAINVISQDDEQLKADIDYMKNAIAYTLEPVVRAIVGLVKDIMVAIQNIIFALTRKNVFENANKSLGSANKNAQKLRKTMASFDEMNVMSDTSSGSSGSTSPSMNLGEINDLTNSSKGLIGVIGAIAGAIGAMKLSELAKTLGLINTELTVMQGLGIFAIILGVYNLINDIIEIVKKFDETIEGNNTTLSDWGKVILDIALIIGGIALVIEAWPVALAAAIVAIIGLLIKNWDTIKKFFEEKVFGWMDSMIEKLEKTTIGSFFAQIFQDSKAVIAELLNVFDGLFKGVKQIFDGIVRIFKVGVVDGLKTLGKGLVNFFISGLNFMLSALNTLLIPVRGLIVAFGKITGKNWNMDNIRIPKIPYLAKGGIINMPGRGVPVGGAYVGEKGQEGVVPLTDSQQMALLGEAIGRYITINAQMNNYMDGRLISRQMEKIQNQKDFALNR